MFSIRTRCFLILCFLLVSLSLSPKTQPVLAYNVCIWTGAEGNGWDNPNNWNYCGGVVPTAIDYVEISSPGPILNGSTTVTLLDIKSSGGLMVVDDAVLTTNYLNMNGHFTGPGEIRVNSIFNYGTGVMDNWINDGILDGGGIITIPPLGRGYIHHNGDYLRMNNFTLVNQGTLSPFSTEPGYIYSVVYLSNNSRIDNYGLYAVDGTYFDMTNNNTIHNHSTGTLQSTNGTILETAVINDGIIDVKGSTLDICRGSPHSGEFKGSAGTSIIFGTCHDGMITANHLVFSQGSKLTTPYVYFTQPGNTIDIHGIFGPIASGTSSGATLWGTVIFHEDSTINTLGGSFSTRGNVTIEGVVPTTPQYDVSLGGNFSYGGTINVSHLLECIGTISNTGMLRLYSSGTMRLSSCTLNQSNIENQGNGWWSGTNTDITLNNSTIENDSTFNLASGDFMSGDENSVFINNGTIHKELYTNTTTFDIPFENNGSLDIHTGAIAFTRDLTLPTGTTNSIGGALQASELINNGTLTVNGTIIGNLTNNNVLYLNGTITGNLINVGYIEIGHSPGLAYVEGDYTQNSVSALQVEFSHEANGGDPVTDPVPGIDFDQMHVAGIASLNGEIILDEGETLNPISFNEFPFITAEGGVIGEFSSLEIDNMIDYWPWYLLYRDKEVTIRFGGFSFLPALLK